MIVEIWLGLAKIFFGFIKYDNYAAVFQPINFNNEMILIKSVFVKKSDFVYCELCN